VADFTDLYVMGLSHLAQNKNTKTSKEKRPFFRLKRCRKRSFKVEILTDFNFYTYFLAALLPSGVPSYADDGKITSSASN
jgi:hypothetical protein